jgi:dTDP-4-dehydrorhamnose reductase
VVINCIGFIGSNVDECEQDKDKTLMSNAFIPLILAEVALRHKIRLVHVSTGCMYHFDYSKDKSIDEDKIPDYFNLFYSRSKIYSDQSLKILSNEFPILIVRPRIPLDNRPSPKNILNKLISYKNNIIDIPNSVTYMPDFVKAVKYLINVEAKGIFNVVNKGGLRYPELLDVYKKYVPDFKYSVIDFKGLKIDRTNIILSTQKLEKSGFKVRDIHEVLEECVKEYLKS